METSKTIKIQEIADELGVSTYFIREAIRQKHFPGIWMHSDNRDTFVVPREAYENFIKGIPYTHLMEKIKNSLLNQEE